MISVSDYAVNTMTLTARSGTGCVDLARLRAEQEAAAAGTTLSGDRPSVSHFSCRDGGRIVRVGRVLKRNGREKRYSDRLFDNQSTVVVRLPYHGGYYINIKIFHNGNLQMTGARSVDEAVEAANFALGSAGGSVTGATVQLMNSNFLIGRRINREELHDVATHSYGVLSSFNPSIYPGVKIYYMFNAHGDGRCRGSPACQGIGKGACCKRITLLVFSGKSNVKTSAAIITGATCHEHISAAHKWLASVVRDHARRVAYGA